MAEMITNLTIIFIAASAMLLIFHRYKHPAIPAYLAAGILVGDVVGETFVLGLAQLGIAFLVFVFGMKLNIDRVYRLVSGHFTATVLQVGVVGGGAFAIATIWGYGVIDSALLAVTASLSSSLIGMELMEREEDITLIHNRLSEAINLVQDLLGILAFVLVAAYPFSTASLGWSLGMAMALFGMALVVREALPWMVEHSDGSREIMMLFGLSTLAGFIVFAEWSGFSLVVGSFAAGLAASKFPYNLEMIDTVGSLKDFFSAILFVSLGVLITFPTAEVLLLAAALIFVTMLLKPAVTVLSLEGHGYDSRTAYLTAINIDQISEFALIMAIQASIAGTISQPVFDAIVLAATVTMLLTSYTDKYAERLYDILAERQHIHIRPNRSEYYNVPDGIRDHTVIAGYDVQGRMIAEYLRERDEPFVVIDNDPERVIEAREEGYPHVFGNVRNERTWERAGYTEARLIISTVPVSSTSRYIVDLETDADIIIRSEDVDVATEFVDECLYVINSDLLATEKLTEHIRGSLENEKYRERLREQSRRDLFE